VLEAPELVSDLKAQFGSEKLTVRTAIQAKLDFTNAELTANGKAYGLSPVGAAAQELVLAGGLEAWTRKRV